MLIDEFSGDVLDTLDDMTESVNKGAIYVLVDGAFLPGLYRRFAAELGEHSVRLLFASLPSVTEEVLEVSPFVFEHRANSPVIRQLLESCIGLPMLSVIQSPEPLGTLAERLSAWTIVSNDEARFNFRFADTRRLPTILRSLSSEQLGTMVGRASSWHYISRTGQWSVVTLPGVARDIQARPQTLDSAQFSVIADDAETDALLSILRQSRYPFEGVPSDHYRCVSLVMEAATAAGLSMHQILNLFEESRLRQAGCLASGDALALQLMSSIRSSEYARAMG